MPRDHLPASSFALFVFSSALSAQFPALGPVRQMLPMLPEEEGVVVHGDVDGDGDADLIVPSSLSDQLLRNDGLGRFEIAWGAMPGSCYSSGVRALVDLDLDGDLDLFKAAGHTLATQNFDAVFTNDGAGTFSDATASWVPADAPPSHITRYAVHGDLDADGDPDLIVGSYKPDGTARVLRNDAGASFTHLDVLPADAGITEAARLVDVDGDQDLDLVGVRAFDENTLVLNEGGLVFRPASALTPPGNTQFVDIAVGDVDGDGDLDALIASKHGAYANELWTNQGAVFSETVGLLPTPVVASHGAELGDVDGDGDLDAWFANGKGLGASDPTNSLFLGDGTGAFADASDRLPPVVQDDTQGALLDVDGDQDVDLVVLSEGRARLELNDGAGRFTDATSGGVPPHVSEVSHVVLEDLDGDGDPDAFVAREGQFGLQNLLLWNDGFGGFEDGTEAALPVLEDETRGAAAGDFDGDGDTDLAVANYGDPSVLLWNRGDGTFALDTGTFAALGSAISDAYTVVAFDADSDLDVDLAFGLQSGELYLRNDGAGAFSAPVGVMPSVTGSIRDWALGDANNDGLLDLAVARYQSSNRLWLATGTGTFEDQYGLIVSGDATHHIELLDLEGDGDLDLAWLNEGTATGPPQANLDVRRNLGAADFTNDDPKLPGYSTHNSHALACLDVNGDGMEDIVLGGYGGPPLSPIKPDVILSLGQTYGATLGAVQLEGMFVEALHAADLDGDGDEELFVGGLRESAVLHRLDGQLSWESVARVGSGVSLESRGPYGAPWFLFASAGQSSLTLPGLGTLLIDPLTGLLVDSGTYTFSGGGEVVVPLSLSPIHVGKALYWQALSGQPPTLGNLERTVLTGL